MPIFPVKIEYSDVLIELDLSPKSKSVPFMTRAQTGSKTEPAQVTEVPVSGFDYIEFYVGNAKQTRYYYEHGLGFEVVGYKGLETGERQITSYAMQQNDVKIVVTGALSPDHEITEHVRKHGDGVKSIGFKVADAGACYEMAVERGAISVSEPCFQQDKYGNFTSASVKTFGDTIHTFVQRNDYRGNFAPGYMPLNTWSGGVGFDTVDHVVGNVDSGGMLDWVAFYEKIFGFHVFQGFDASDIKTQYSALTSRVMANKSGTIKMPINEPAPGEKKSQIQEYLDFYEAPGVQHIALSTNNIISTVSTLRKRGIDFMFVPPAYYDNLNERVGAIDEDIVELARLGILVDRESKGYLLQIFTKPVEDRPTLFFEIIQRKNGASGFGKGNFLALFESLEREQERRGNL